MKLFLCASAAALSACAAGAEPGAPAPQATELRVPQSGLQEMPLVIRSDSKSHRFTVEVARTPEQQRHGMMFRTALDADRGMLFPYASPQVVAFWMRDTLIPLDILFIGSDRRIVRVATAKPRDDSLVGSGEPIIAVLEIAGGRAAQLGISPGDRADW